MNIQKIKTKLTPIRYPGGKSNALKFLDKYLVKNFKEYREPFFGGGSVGLYLMQYNKNADYWINDLCYPVFCFWNVLYHNPHEMSKYILDKKQKFIISTESIIKGIPSKNAQNGELLHTECRAMIDTAIKNKDVFHTACMWYILNKLSYSGMSMIGSYAPLAWDQNFSDRCINNLPMTSELLHSVKSIKITNLDYSDVINTPSTNDTFIFLDPPYKIIHNLYGKNGDMHSKFDHQLFSNTITKNTSCKWMLTYNEDIDIKTWFAEYNQLSWNLQYTMKSANRNNSDGTKSDIKSGKTGKELLITNY